MQKRDLWIDLHRIVKRELAIDSFFASLRNKASTRRLTLPVNELSRVALTYPSEYLTPAFLRAIARPIVLWRPA